MADRIFVATLTILAAAAFLAVAQPEEAGAQAKDAKAQTAPSRPAAEVQPAPAGDKREFDLNGDKKSDVWVHYRVIDDPEKPGSKKEITVQKEMDVNFDGRLDIWKYYNDKGDLVKECFDLDFDGRTDECVFYEKGVAVRKELDLNFDGKPDLFKYYEKGKLIRKEKASKGDGKIDTWEYYENEELDRIGVDTNGDGQVEQWQKKTK
jgi:antitoxin component YwqK of YwqJK toxin-antitoxin module